MMSLRMENGIEFQMRNVLLETYILHRILDFDQMDLCQ